MYFMKERINRILNELSSYIYLNKETVPQYVMKEGTFKGGEAIDLDTKDWADFYPNSYWGGKDRHFWFRTLVKIPEAFQGKPVVFTLQTGKEGQWDALNPQFLAYVNGTLIHGLDVNHREVLLTSCAQAGEHFLIALYAYSGMNSDQVILNSQISILDEKVKKLYYHMKTPLEIASALDPEDKKSIDILNFLNEAVNLLDLRKPFSEAYRQSVEAAIQFMETKFYDRYCGNEDVQVHGVGHTHIDIAWRWAIAQTREKAVRSFSTVLSLMKEYPEYIFMSSQPQLYEYVKEDEPELYSQMKQRIQEGRWEPEGAMWLEADCNLASGESLIRQILVGTRFFQKEFGVENKILWLPDVFGYSAALPQILKKSGIDYFMTTKISWNEYNKMPYDTFMWKGIDGTDILTHFICTSKYEVPKKNHYTTYVGTLTPSEVMGTWQRYQQKNINNDVLFCYGYGDGGGGPTGEMLEYARRMEKGIPGCPKVKLGTSLDYFKKLEQDIQHSKKLPQWAGELYLEYHRGTYTSMAKNKKYNRKSEFLYQDAEWLSILNQEVSGTGYPHEKLEAGWKKILLNQFHDILPGSSIKEVYDDSTRDYIEVLGAGNEMLQQAFKGISSHITLEEASVVVFNQLGHTRDDIVAFDLPEGYGEVRIVDEEGNSIPSQLFHEDSQNKILFFAENIPSKGYKAYMLTNENTPGAPNSKGALYASPTLLSNKFFDIHLDHEGNIISILDKSANREVLKNGASANVLQVFEDKPHNYDAWDINIYYQEKMWLVNEVESIEVTETGPVRATVKVRRKFLDSVIVQNISIYRDIPRIDFRTWIDWKEEQLLLKSSFPVDIHTDKATYEIQFGNVERPTHWNTSWDYARFEVCAHKWADLSEDGYGVSLLNDCKYGHDIKDGVMRLTLLKSAKWPYEAADKEIHEFTYSLYPHQGDWKAAGTVNMAYALNCPMYTALEPAHPGELPAVLSLVSANEENIVIETIKKAEDSNDIILRVYECYNRRTQVTLEFFKGIGQVWECNMLEVNIQELNSDGNQFRFEIKPYEIKTFKIRL